MPLQSNLATRILPGLASEYTIVSLPQWAWMWIDDHVEIVYENDFHAFINETRHIVKDEKQLGEFLSLMASDLRDHQMRTIHNLANDNNVLDSTNPVPIQNTTPRHKPLQFPTILMVFKFLPHATDLKTIWARRNYQKFF